MQRAHSIYGSSSALRGVHLKVGDKFKPPAKVTLPVGWKTRDPSRLLDLSYDFTLEEDVMAKIKAERDAKEKLEEAQKFKEQQNKVPTPSPAIAHMGSDILQPTTAATTTTTTTTENKSVDTTSKDFNYKDFEDNTDTPFEVVELECINEMEALKSVLQPDVECDSSASVQPQIPPSSNNDTHGVPIPSSGMPINSTINQFNPHLSPHSLETNFPVSGSPVNPVNLYQLGSQDNPVDVQTGQPIPANPFSAEAGSQHLINNGIVTGSSPPNTVPYSPGNTATDTDRRISLPGAMRVLPPAPARPPPRRPVSAPNKDLTSDMTSGFQNQTEVPSSSDQKRPVPKPRSKLPPLRSGSEASPLQEPLYDVPPPPIPPKKSIGKSRTVNHTQEPHIPVDDANLKWFSPLPPISPPKPGHVQLFNDPRSTMTAEEIQFVNQISTMGFPVGRAARAVKNLGCKQREVIEFLISVNDMCNLGYSESHVEMVLKDNSDQSKAVEFLKLIVQFKELGFHEEKIFEALKKSECDSNKTLDILTCAG